MHEIITPHLPKLPSDDLNEDKTRYRGVEASFRGETKITSAVKVQSTIVSKKTSKMPRQACVCAHSFFEEACAEGDVPHPASFERSPRLVPYRTASFIVKPNAPETAVRKENADLKMRIKAEGI